jgi:hypothetical protein
MVLRRAPSRGRAPGLACGAVHGAASQSPESRAPSLVQFAGAGEPSIYKIGSTDDRFVKLGR